MATLASVDLMCEIAAGAMERNLRSVDLTCEIASGPMEENLRLACSVLHFHLAFDPSFLFFLSGKKQEYHQNKVMVN